MCSLAQKSKQIARKVEERSTSACPRSQGQSSKESGEATVRVLMAWEVVEEEDPSACKMVRTRQPEERKEVQYWGMGLERPEVEKGVASLVDSRKMTGRKGGSRGEGGREDRLMVVKQMCVKIGRGIRARQQWVLTPRKRRLTSACVFGSDFVTCDTCMSDRSVLEGA